MNIQNLTQSTSIDINNLKDSRKVQNGKYGDFYLIKYDNSKNRAIVFSNKRETKLVCAGKPGIWMEQVMKEYEQSYIENPDTDFQTNASCPEDVFDTVVSDDFYLVSTPAGLIELRKDLNDGFLSITSLGWDDDIRPVDQDNDEWVVARYENFDIVNADDISQIFVNEPVNLSKAIMNSYVLADLDWKYLDSDFVCFGTWQDVKDRSKQSEFTM